MIKRLSLLLLTGCVANDGLRTMSMSQDNIWNLSRLCIGMDESQVLQIMHYPYQKKTVTHGDAVYQIWFYVTRPVGLAQSRLVRQNMTPLTFENGVLQGWGFAYYQHILGQKPVEKKVSEPPKTPDDKSLEHAIEGIEKAPVTSQNQESPPKEEKPKEEDEEHLDDEDREMIDEEHDQNFNFW